MTLRRALLLVVAFVAVLAPTRWLTMRFVPDPEAPFAPSLAFWLGLLFSTVVAVVGVVWLGSVKVHGSWRAQGWHADALVRRLGLGVIGGAITVGVVVVMALSAGLTLGDVRVALTDVGPAQRLVFIGIGLQAAFVEESLFRGNLQPLLQARFGPLAGLVVTAMIFSAYHGDPRPFSLVGKFVYGLLYGALRARDGSLASSATAHFLVWAVAGSL